MRPKKVGLIVFEHVAAADLTGPAEVFSRANTSGGNGCESSCYNVLMLGITAQPYRTECGIVVKPHTDLASAPALDTLIIPGGTGIRNEKVTNTIANWLNHRSSTTRRIATLGTGIYPLAATGMLDDRQVATHWRYATDVAQRFPNLRVNANCLFVKDGPFYTSAGAMAGIDLSLSLIEEDYGIRVALVIARELVVSAKRSGLQEQYPETLQFQTRSVSRLAELTTWMRTYRWRYSLPRRVSVRGTLPGDSSRNSVLLLLRSSRGCGLMKHVTVFPSVTIVSKTLRCRWDSKAQLRFGARFSAG